MAGKHIRVLVVDDDRAHGESLTDLLNSRGREAYFARDLAEALWYADLLPFDVALLDHDMPGADGPEVARRLRERQARLRTILMSAREENEPAPAERPAPSFVAKPIRINDLLALIDRVRDAPAENSLILRVSFPVDLRPRDPPRG